VLIAQELVLLALDPDRGVPVNSSRAPLTACLSGALVAELGLGGLVGVQGRRFAVTGTPPAPGLLHDVYQALRSPAGRRSADQLRRLDRQIGGSWKRVVDGLVEAGIVDRRPVRRLLWTLTTHPVLAPAVRQEVLDRVRAAAAGEGPIDPRTAVVLALSGPARLLEVVAPDHPRDHAKQRIAQAADATPVAPVVQQVIREAQAAAAVAVIVASTAGTSST